MNDETAITLLQQKIDQLNKQAFEGRVNDSNRSHVLCTEALNLAKDINYTRGKAEGLRTSSYCLLRLSRNIEAKEAGEEALQLYRSLNDAASEGYVYCGLGVIQRNLGDYKTSLELMDRSLELIKQTNYREVEPMVYYHIGITHKYMGNLELALENILTSLSIEKEINSGIAGSYTLGMLGTIYEELGDYDNAREYHYQSLLIRQKTGDKWGEAGSLNNLGSICFKQDDHQKAQVFCEQTLTIARSVGDKKGEANSLFHLAQINNAQRDDVAALDNANQSLKIREAISDKKGQAEIYLCLAGMPLQNPGQKYNLTEQLKMLNKALKLSEETKAQDLLLKVHHSFYKVFKQLDQYEQALEHLELSNAIEKEIHTKSFNQKILNLEITHKIEQSKKEAEIYRIRTVELADLYEESNRQRQEIEDTLTELRSTQTQLIQKEKMASLGELTAGVAHEIQNPLNFVNNFSEINTELIQELVEEAQRGNTEEVILIAKDIQDNESKINHHGKRADAIVKGMLQHSQSRAGQKELTDVNKLADEYLRLSYHGLRAKDKSFNATMQTEFDNSIGKINIIQQDIGRVIFNIINNAFYAVNEKKKQQPEGYEPTVLLSTKKTVNKVLIAVKDNGNGIPQNIVDKIFQPFFTTKPTGQGTGLGLSLSYDIIKAHGGEIRVESKEGEGSEFVIQLPINEKL